MSHRRSRSGSPPLYSTHSNDPRELERRIFVGNLPTSQMEKKDLVDLFRPYGKIQALSLLRGYGFVQFERPEDANAAAAGHCGRLYRGYKLDVNMAVERQRKPRSSPPRRPPVYGDGREPRPRSRSPGPGRDSRERRDSRDTRDHSQEPRTGAPRVPVDSRFRGSDGRDKDPRDAPCRPSVYGDGREPRPRSRSPGPGRDSREHRDSRDTRDHSQEPRTGAPRVPVDSRFRGSDGRDKDPRDAPYRPPVYGDGREPRPRSRSPGHGRDSRERRDSRDTRDHSQEPRTGAPRVPVDSRFRGSDGRVKDPRDAPYSYDRGYRGEYEPFRKKEEAYPDHFREPWTGRRGPEVERIPPEEQRRNELYRQYYEELQRRYDAERPVDCSVIVVNKLQKEYAETVGRKVRDLGMVVDLIFLNTEVSLTQALEDVSRAHTPFAIVITQQHEVHHSCTVNILFGTAQEHRNMPIEDAMLLVAHNYDSFKVENRAKECEEIARKSAKMADEVLMRELDREHHPVSLLTAVTLLYEGRLLMSQELTGLINYLQDKRDRLVRVSTDSRLGPRSSSVPIALDPVQPTQSLTSTHAINSSHLLPGSTTSSSQQLELQAKILSLFNNAGASVTSSSMSAPPSQGYGSTQTTSLSGSSLSNPITPTHESQSLMNSQVGSQATGNHMSTPQGPQRAPINNFDHNSVQKAIDTLIQSGPAINQLVNSTSQRVGPGMNQSMGQGAGPGMNPGRGQGAGQGMNQGMAHGMNQGRGRGINQVGMLQGAGQVMNQGRGRGMTQGLAQGAGPGMNQGRSQGMNQGMGQGMNHGMGQVAGQGLTQGRGQGMNSGMGQGLNHGMGQGAGQGMSQGRGQGIGHGYSQGLGQGMGQTSQYSRHY